MRPKLNIIFPSLGGALTAWMFSHRQFLNVLNFR